MREIFADLDRWQEEGEEIALATLVCVRGSAPRLPGARLWLTRSGRMAGSVSGGCVESDVFERAVQVLDSRQPAVATYGIADELGFEVGLSCGGSIDVLIEPFAADAVWQAARHAVENQRPVALGIGIAPLPLAGRKLAVLDDDTVIGSIDSSVDQQVTAAARCLLPKGGTMILTTPGRGEDATIFIEAISPPQRLFIVGATHAAVALCRMAKGLGFRVTVIDVRGAYATRERFPDADELLRALPGEVLDQAGLDACSHIVILTHDPKFDIPTLKRALRSPARYIGVMASRRTYERRKAQLAEEGFGRDDFARIRAPIGLDIGARTPEEIALAILAEMLAVRCATDGRSLSEKNGLIHGRS
ncbi:MAG: XdhC family protein [Candidatus Binatia bacterium]